VNYKDTLRIYKEDSKDFLESKKDDKPALREAWSNYIDGLCKDGEITLQQYENWGNPF
tara:strand:- start:486 stop:659 length:174 start_codon:yes stop_codon:yes gene_type:complete